MTALGKTLFSLLMIGGGFGLASLVGPPEAVQQFAERLTPQHQANQWGELRPAATSNAGADWSHFAHSQVDRLVLSGEDSNSPGGGVTPLSPDENLRLSPTPHVVAEGQALPPLEINSPQAQPPSTGWNMFAASGQQQQQSDSMSQQGRGQVVPAQGLVPVGQSSVRPATTGWQPNGWQSKDSQTNQQRSLQPPSYQQQGASTFNLPQPSLNQAPLSQPPPDRYSTAYGVKSGPPPADAWHAQSHMPSASNVATRQPLNRGSASNGTFTRAAPAANAWQQVATQQHNFPSQQTDQPVSTEPPVTQNLMMQAAPSSIANTNSGMPQTHGVSKEEYAGESFLPWDSSVSSQATAAANPPQLMSPVEPAPAGAWSNVVAVGQATSAQSAAVPSSPVSTFGELNQQQRHHLVADGDTLERIARRYLGDPSKALELFAWNRDVLRSPELLPIGAEIRVSRPANSPPATPTAGNTANVSFAGSGNQVPASIGGMVPAVASPPQTGAPRAQLLGPQPAMSAGAIAGW